MATLRIIHGFLARNNQESNMYKPKMPATFRLPKVNSAPTYTKLLSILQESEQLHGRKIELPCQPEDQSKDFLLSVTKDGVGGEPCWTLIDGSASRDPILWSHSTGDLALIENLVAASFAGGNFNGTKLDKKNNAQGTQPLGVGSAMASLQQSEAQKPSVNRVNAGDSLTKSTFEGQLMEMRPPNLLQSISFSGLTGRLLIDNGRECTEIYFDEGQPIHAQSGETTGDHAVLDLLAWQEGSFRFFPNERTTMRTFKKRLDALMLEGVALADQSQYLKKVGLSEDSYLIVKNPHLTEEEFDLAVALGVPTDLAKQKNFYCLIDSRSKLIDLLRQQPMSKPESVPILFNLLGCNLVIASASPAQKAEHVTIADDYVDRAAIDAAVKVMKRPETGLFTYPIFLYFVERELLRFKSGGSPFSIIIFELAKKSGPLTPADLQECTNRITSVIRPMDFLAHFQTLSYVLLLPQTNADAGSLVARAVVERLYAQEANNSFDPQSIIINMGIAGVPEDCQQLGQLLSSANKAKDVAKKRGVSILSMRSLTVQPLK